MRISRKWNRKSKCHIRPQSADPGILDIRICRIDPLDIRSEVEPRGEGQVVIKLDPLFVTEGNNRAYGGLEIIAEVVEIVTDSKRVIRSGGHHAMPGESADN